MIFLVLGRGKTGSVVADVAAKRGHSVQVIGEEENPNASALTGPMLTQFDTVIDFTTPQAVIHNIRA
jgi:4-hydroxy-tetrahydrodipicolinate reductase